MSNYLPPFTPTNPLLQVALFPDGNRIILQLVRQYVQSGADIIVTFTDATTYTYTASDSATAGQIILAIDKMVQNGWTFFLLDQATES